MALPHYLQKVEIRVYSAVTKSAKRSSMEMQWTGTQIKVLSLQAICFLTGKKAIGEAVTVRVCTKRQQSVMECLF